ncbi:MAG: S41 family peptidase [Solirubrobacteraceae bacterium]
MFDQRSRGSSRGLMVVVGVVALLVGLVLGGHPSWLPGPVRSAFTSDNGNDKIVDDVMGLLQQDYYRRINRAQLLDKGLAAAVASLNDPYSHYFSRTDYQSFESQSNPHLSGIGIDVETEPRGVQVLDVFPGSPAARAGLGRGDLITSVGATSLADRSSSFSASLIKGRAGTRVSLTVLSGRRTRTVSLVRANLVVPVTSSDVVTVSGRKLGVVQLTSFTPGSGDEVRAQVQKVLRKGAQGIILDLRENGGGLLEEAVNVASIFIPDGTIVSTAGRSQPRQVYLVKRQDTVAPRTPLVVLVDHGTASAAEIVTGALQDRGRAKVVGTHTYGKGVFQEIQPLPNGGALDFTVGEYFTPSGRNLGGGGVRRGAGISPDIYASTNLRDKTDTALRVAERTVAAEIR